MHYERPSSNQTLVAIKDFWSHGIVNSLIISTYLIFLMLMSHLNALGIIHNFCSFLVCEAGWGKTKLCIFHLHKCIPKPRTALRQRFWI